MDLLKSRKINDDVMVIIKGVEQDPDLGMEIVHSSTDDYSKAADSEEEENNNDNDHKTPYDGENMNASSDDEGNND